MRWFNAQTHNPLTPDTKYLTIVKNKTKYNYAFTYWGLDNWSVPSEDITVLAFTVDSPEFVLKDLLENEGCEG